jgi:hypothetical protein
VYELKSLRKDAVPAALAKAERYRLLNEPAESESICRDVLRVEPGNQAARVMLLLSLTDQFDEGRAGAEQEAIDLVRSLEGDYERIYYQGLVLERRAKASLHRGIPGSGGHAYEWLVEAMAAFETAERIRPPGNDEAILRWNACARTIMDTPHVKPGGQEREAAIESE